VTAKHPGIQRHHHITLCVGSAQEDYDFYTQVLGLKSVKKTALYDGDVPIYHLYYGNDVGLESTWSPPSPCANPGASAGRARIRPRF
jgi:glyoxalase family protein